MTSKDRSARAPPRVGPPAAPRGRTHAKQAPSGSVSPRPKRATATPETPSEAAARAIYRVVRAIPPGKVATYGQIAALAGIPAGHRVAARAMQTCPPGLPWHRVVGKKDARRAQISIQEGEHAALQRALLVGEGVAFDASGLIPLRAAGWLPTDVPTTRKARRR